MRGRDCARGSVFRHEFEPRICVVRFLCQPNRWTLQKLSRFMIVAVVLGCLLAAPQESLEVSKPGQVTFDYFQEESLPEFRLSFDEFQANSLRENPREYTRANLYENGQLVRAKIKVKLKGAAGSYQDFDARPGFTVRVDKDVDGRRFHGMRKFHLNTSVQDPTYMSEWLGSQFFRSAGYPAPLVRHVHLWIDDRDMGIYVLREGFDEPFLERSFGSSEGDLFDGGFLQDIDEPLELDSGDEDEGVARLQSLAEACKESNYELRMKRIEEELDTKEFVRFMALERMLAHWDGYTLNTNNYRLYFPEDGKAIFLPHGMDQVLGDPWAGVWDPTSILVARVVMENDRLRNDYREELRRLVPLFADSDRWARAIDSRALLIRPGLKSLDGKDAEDHYEQVQQLKERIRERGSHLFQLINEGPANPVSFDEQSTLVLNDWHRHLDDDRIKAERVSVEGRELMRLELKSDEAMAGSWRMGVLLPRGRYEFKARVRTYSVTEPDESEEFGAGLRRQGERRTGYLDGTHDWRPLVHEFEVVEDRHFVELVLELYAREGRMEIDVASLKLERLD